MFDSCYLQLQGEYDKPEGILFDNSGKAGVDTRNRGAYIYNNKRITRRWPHAIFCYMLGIFTDNARVILSSMMPSIVPPTRKSGWKDFNLKLSRQLVRAKMGQMVYRPHLDVWSKKYFTVSMAYRDDSVKLPELFIIYQVEEESYALQQDVIITHTTPAIIVEHIVAGIVQRLHIHVQMRCNVCSDDNKCFYPSLQLLYKMLFEYMLPPTIILYTISLNLFITVFEVAETIAR